MKIKPSIHNIIQTEEINLKTDIPLAYIDTENKDYEFSFSSANNISLIKPIVPYRYFDSYEFGFFKPFDKDNLSSSSSYEKIDNFSLLQRVGKRYQYIPLNARNFAPEEFEYNIIVKKNISYNPNTYYDIKINCIDDTSNSNRDSSNYLSRKLMKVFGDASDRGLAPNNIRINNKDISVFSLSNSKFADLDFIFIESKDGLSYKTSDGTSYSLKNSFTQDFLNYQTNIWVSVENFPIKLENGFTGTLNGIKNPIFQTTSSTVSFFAESQHNFQVETENNEKIIQHTLSCNNQTCAIIKEYVNKGFVIYSPKKFFDDITSNFNSFYEILMYVYSYTYLKSEPIRQWITDKIPDYIVINDELTKGTECKTINPLKKIFNLEENNYTYSSIIINKENIIIDKVYNDYVFFKKLYTEQYSKYADPIKKANEISIYTPQQQIIYYEDIYYEIEDNILNCIVFEKQDNELSIQLKDYKSSKYNIEIKQGVINKISIPFVQTVDYKKIAIKDSDFIITYKDDFLNYFLENDFNELKNKDTFINLFTINIKKTLTDPVIYDLRQRGGGLPENYEDDYNLLDIGHLYGLSYRKSGTIVITLPKRLKPYKDIIYNKLSNHIVAEKLLILLFKDEGADV